MVLIERKQARRVVTTSSTRTPAPAPEAATATKPAPVEIGNDYKVNLAPDANDRFDVVMLKWTVNKESLLPSGIRLTDRDSDRDIDLRHQIETLKSGFAAELAILGRKREGRVDTGEELIHASNCSTPEQIFEQLVLHNFVLLDIHAQRKQGKGKFDSDKFVLVCVFGRNNGELTTFSTTDAFLEDVFDLIRTNFQHLHVWGNPDGTMTWNFGGRSPDQAAKSNVAINDGKLGVYPR